MPTSPGITKGDFKTYIMSDKGIDNLGGAANLVDPPTELRGRFLWEHEHFLPDDWQVQLRSAMFPIPRFLRNIIRANFDTGLPYNAEFYAKRQEDTEVLTFLAESDTTRFITNSDRQQEQFDVARLPEITYQRIGDSFADDQLTLFSNNSAAALKFDQSAFTLASAGIYTGLSPGLPSDGYTGTTGNIIFRGDTRQEVDWPFSLVRTQVRPVRHGPSHRAIPTAPAATDRTACSAASACASQPPSGTWMTRSIPISSISTESATSFSRR